MGLLRFLMVIAGNLMMSVALADIYGSPVGFATFGAAVVMIGLYADRFSE